MKVGRKQDSRSVTHNY